MVDSASTRAPVAAATGARARAVVNVGVREHKSTAGRLCQAAAAATMDSIDRAKKMLGNTGYKKGTLERATMADTIR
jgi:hypothetical protein